MEQLPFPVDEVEESVIEPVKPELKLVPKPRPDDDVIDRAVASLMRFHDLGEDDWPVDWHQPSY